MRSLVRTVNTGVSALLENPWTGPWIRKGITTVSYTGRRSGRAFSTPVAYRRNGDKVTLWADLPGTKNWWRNFTGDGGPVTLRLDGTNRTGHAIAHRTSVGWATVTVTLDQPASELPSAGRQLPGSSNSPEEPASLSHWADPAGCTPPWSAITLSDRTLSVAVS